MKRKVWIMLALAVLIAALGCVSAMAFDQEEIVTSYQANQEVLLGSNQQFSVALRYENHAGLEFQWFISDMEIPQVGFFKDLSQFSSPEDANIKRHVLNSTVSQHASVSSWTGSSITITPNDTFLDGKYLSCYVCYRYGPGNYEYIYDWSPAVRLSVYRQTLDPITIPETAEGKVGDNFFFKKPLSETYTQWWCIRDPDTGKVFSRNELQTSITFSESSDLKQVTIKATNTWLDGKQFYWVAQNPFGFIGYSNYCTFSVQDPGSSPPGENEVFTIQPAYHPVAIGTPSVFSVYAPGAIRYEWFFDLYYDFSYNGSNDYEVKHYSWAEAESKGFVSATGTDSRFLSLTVLTSPGTVNEYYDIHCRAYFENGSSFESNLLRLTASSVYQTNGVYIENPLPSFYHTELGNSITFNVKAQDYQGNDVSYYRWTVRSPGMSNSWVFADITDHVTLDYLSEGYIRIIPLDLWLSGKLLECKIVTSSGESKTISVQLSITNPFEASMASQNISVSLDKTYSNTLEPIRAIPGGALANNANDTQHLHYQWQKLDENTQQWKDVTGAVESILTPKLPDIGQYRVKMTADSLTGEVYSNPCQVNMRALKGSVTLSPDQTAWGETVNATITGEAGTIIDPAYLRYQWYRNGAVITGANGTLYETTIEDKNTTLTLVVSSEYCTGVISGTADITGKSFRVQFNMNGHGAQIADQFIMEDQTATRPETPTAEGYLFVNWFTNAACTKPFTFSTPITGDTVIYLSWAKCITVSFVPNGGTGVMEDINLLAMNYIILPECGFTPPEGAVFKAWRVTTGTMEFQPGESRQTFDNITYCPVWAGPFTVTFDPDGGSGTMASVTVGYGEAYTLPECGFTPPAGKKFAHWNVEIGDTTTLLWPRYTMTVTQNMTLKPEWRTARATFQANGGTGILTPVDMVPDSSGYITLPECSLNPPDGRMFAGWLVGGTVYQPGQRAPIYGDTLIPAQWTTAHYTVTYDKNGGSGSMASFTTQGDTFTLPDCGFTPPAGKQFAYWIVPAAVTNYKLYYPGQTVQINADTAVQAIWTDARPSSWTVSFTHDEGSGTMPSITVADEAYLTFPECAFTPPAGKIFEHWVLKTADGYYMGTYHPGDQAQIYQDYIGWPYYRNLVTHYVNFYDPSNYNILNTQDIVEGGLVSVPEVSVPGYTLHSWYFRYRPDENSDWVTVPFDFGQPVEFYLALEGDPDGTTISVWAELTQNEHHIALTVSDGGTAQLDPAQDTYHYGDVVYINWEMDSGCHYEGITITPADGESQALDYNYFTMPDCDVAVDVRFLRPVIHSGTFGDGLYWSLNEGSLTIGGVGAMPDFTWENEAPWMAWKDEIYGVEIQSGITAVGNLAFTEISSLGYASLPGTVTRIDSMAFYCCSALGGIQLPDGLTVLGDGVFQETAITTMDIPAGVRVIGESAFAGCVQLTGVTLHEGLQVIGDSAFSYCESLTEISIPQTVTTIESYAFDNCTSLQRVSGLEHLETLPYGLFCECNSLTDIGLLPRISVIPGDFFARCHSLSSIAIPGTVIQIEDWAFDECDSLTAVYYEGSRAMWDAISIGDYNDGLEHATIYCKLVVSFETNCDAVIPDQLINYGECPTIPETPFVAGSLFTGWYLESSLDTSCDFSDPLYEDTVLYADWFTPDPRWTLRLPDQLVRVESEAFWGVRAETVAVPRGVTYIADDAFSARVEYVMGFPSTAAEDWANAHGAAFIEIDDAWMAVH